MASNIPIIEDAGSMKNGVWIPNWKSMASQAKKLGAKTVKTKSGKVIYFDNNYNPTSVDENPQMKGGGKVASNKTVTCSNCGWSWNKSDSSNKDMYVCHQCGRDNSNKSEGWLDNYEQGGMVLKQKTEDNYGKKPNLNDVQVTMPPGFVGMGNNTKGRNYSPAWGGQFQNGGKATTDSVRHQASKILQYEQLRGGPGGAPLSYYSDPKYMNMLMDEVYPEVKKIMPGASAMESGEAMDFIFNAGWDETNNKITKDPRAYALQEYYRQNDSSKLDADGKWAGRKNPAYSFDQEYNNTIGKLPENERRILMNKGRDWYYRNINNPAPGVPNSNYNDTWYGRIWNTNDYQPFDPKNPKFTPKKQMGGSLPPIFTEDRNKVKAYNDSLGAYNSESRSVNALNKWNKNPTEDNKQKYLEEQFNNYDWFSSYTNSQGIKKEGLNPISSYRSINSVPDGVPYNIWRYKKPVQPYIYQEPKRLERTNYTPELIRAEKEFVKSPKISPVDIPQQDNTYRVDYTDPETGKGTYKDFPNEKMGSEFQRSIEGNRTGYYKKFQGGGFLQPTSPKLPMGYDIPSNTPSTELSISIGGGDGEPAYLIPSFKGGRKLKDPIAEYIKTGEHLGGPFKTLQEAEKFGEMRHKYVEKGQDIPTPIKTWGDMAMGGSLPGSVGFTYARTAGSAPANGKYTKKTLASAQNGQEMSYYQHGLDFKTKGMKNGGWLDAYDVPQAQEGNVFAKREQPTPASESTSTIRNIKGEGKSTTATTGQRKEDVKLDTEGMARFKAAETKDKQERIAERKSAIAAKDKGKPFTLPTGESKKYEDMDWREKAYVSGKSLESKGRFNENDEALYDDINPVSWITDIAGGLATAPLEAREYDSNLPYVGAVLNPLIQGALGFDPLGGAMKVPGRVAQSIESGILSNAYKLNPYAFKPNSEAYYRMIGKEGYVDALESGIVRPPQTTRIFDQGAQEYVNIPIAQFDEAYYNAQYPLDRRWYPNSIKRTNPKKALNAKKSGYQGPYMAEVTGDSYLFENGENVASYHGPNSSSTVTYSKEHIPITNPNLKFYKEDWLKGYKEVPKKEQGGVVKDDMGYWNPNNRGKVVEIDSPYITMEGVDEPLIGISDKGDKKYMLPGKNYKFKGKKVREYPVAKNGLRQEQKGLQNLDQLTNFTNYNKPQPGGWLNKYN